MAKQLKGVTKSAQQQRDNGSGCSSRPDTPRSAPAAEGGGNAAASSGSQNGSRAHSPSSQPRA
jgi:hypothetical protein